MKLSFNFKELLAYIAMLILGTMLSLGILYRPQVKRWFEPAYREADFSAYFAAHNEKAKPKVLLYGTSWCSYCSQTREYFKSHQIEFIDLDIESFALAKQQYATFATDSIPVVLIGQRRIDGFNPLEYEKALALLASPSVNKIP